MSFNRRDIDLFTQSHAATARTSFRDKGPLTQPHANQPWISFDRHLSAILPAVARAYFHRPPAQVGRCNGHLNEKPGRTGARPESEVCFTHKECHPRLLAASIQAESLVSVKQKPQPEDQPGLSWLTDATYVAYSGGMHSAKHVDQSGALYWTGVDRRRRGSGTAMVVLDRAAGRRRPRRRHLSLAQRRAARAGYRHVDVTKVYAVRWPA